VFGDHGRSALPRFLAIHNRGFIFGRPHVRRNTARPGGSAIGALLAAKTTAGHEDHDQE